MMEELNKLLKHVKRTNPKMSEEKLKEELSKCRYSAVVLIMVWKSEKN